MKMRNWKKERQEKYRGEGKEEETGVPSGGVKAVGVVVLMERLIVRAKTVRRWAFESQTIRTRDVDNGEGGRGGSERLEVKTLLDEGYSISSKASRTAGC
jgi:hypothetical protein